MKTRAGSRFSTEAAQDISFDAMREHPDGRDENRQLPTRNVDGFISVVGAGPRFPQPEQRPDGFSRLKDQRKLKRNPDHPGDAREICASAGIDGHHAKPPLISAVGGMASKALYQYSLQDTDVQELFRWAPLRMEKDEAKSPGFQDVSTDNANRRPAGQREIEPATRPPRWGSHRSRLRTAFMTPTASGRGVHDLRRCGRNWGGLRVEPQYHPIPPRSRSFTSASFSAGTMHAPSLFRWDAVAKLTRTVGPTSISHVGQPSAVTILLQTGTGYSLGNRR